MILIGTDERIHHPDNEPGLLVHDRTATESFGDLSALGKLQQFSSAVTPDGVPRYTVPVMSAARRIDRKPKRFHLMRTNAAGCAEPENAGRRWRRIRQAKECDVTTIDATPKAKVNQSEASGFLRIQKRDKNASAASPASGILDHVCTCHKKRFANKEASSSWTPMLSEHFGHAAS